MGTRMEYLLGQTLPWTEEQVLALGQTALSLTHSYQLGSSRLAIYLNGVLLFRGIDYNEINSNRIDFLCTVAEFDRVFIRHW